jgi:CBS domain-containing protein
MGTFNLLHAFSFPFSLAICQHFLLIPQQTGFLLTHSHLQYTFSAVSSIDRSSSNLPPSLLLRRAVEITAPFIVALKKMTHKALHRIPVVDGAGHLEFIMTQSAIMTFISKNLGLFPGADKTVGELNLGYKAQVVAARRTQTAGSAFVSMLTHKVSGLAVVDDNNKLVGNISATDLKSIGYDGKLFLKLFLTVGEFTGNKPAFFVTPAHTVSDVVALFAEKRVHRLYVCQGDREILGVISLVDLLKVFLAE